MPHNFFFLGEPFNFCAILDDYSLDKLLGEGGYGKVNLAIHRQNGKQVAVKFMDIAESCKSITLHANFLFVDVYIIFVLAVSKWQTPRRCRTSTRKP